MNERAKSLRELGERIRVDRKRAGLNQEELCAAIGMSRPHLSKLENGHHVPSFATAEKLAEFFRRPVEWFEAEELDVPDAESMEAKLSALEARLRWVEEEFRALQEERSRRPGGGSRSLAGRAGR